jgi:hypothetical protein
MKTEGFTTLRRTAHLGCEPPYSTLPLRKTVAVMN